MENIREYLKHHRLVMDGAMGTYYAKLAGVEQAFCELANLDNPDIIHKIHTEYVEAGAKLIRTNTFAANSQVLAMDFNEVKNVIEKACDIALTVASGRAYVAGDIGTIPENTEFNEDAVLDEYKKICDIFIEKNMDVILFETFSDTYYIQELVTYIRSKSNVFIMTNYCLNKNGYTSSGYSAAKLMNEAAAIEGIDACGFNCGIGSGHMNQIMKKMKFSNDRYITCLPNAGYPEQMQNRMIFMDNADYFADNMKNIADMGIDIIGGCCGTTPVYISKIISKISMEAQKRAEISHAVTISKTQESTKNEFYSLFETGKKVIAVELDPPYDAEYDKLIEYAHVLKKCGVDIITMADSPMGRSRVDSILMSVKVAKETGMNVMPHVCCRDKNMIAIRSSLLGAYISDIRNLLLVTGDPVPSTSRISTTGVFDYNSIRLMNFVKEMNEEHFANEPFYYGGALNVTNGNLDKIIERMNKKIDAGASYFMTQPVFSDEAVERLKIIKEKVDTKILCGIMPFVSYRNANFIKNEFIGIDVPDSIVDRYTPEMSKDEAEETGACIACELMEKLNTIVDGYYFMLPFNRVSLMERIMGR